LQFIKSKYSYVLNKIKKVVYQNFEKKSSIVFRFIPKSRIIGSNNIIANMAYLGNTENSSAGRISPPTGKGAGGSAPVPVGPAFIQNASITLFAKLIA
jgi:hypothetical protein